MLRWLWDWFCVWCTVCVLCGVTRADVMLWGQGETAASGLNTPYIIKQHESRTQQFYYKDPFEIHALRLHLNDNPLSSGFGRVTVWLAGESIYSGPAVQTITGLSKRLDAGWHPLTVIGLENQSQWTGTAGNPVGSMFGSTPAPGLNLKIYGMSMVPEPEFAGLLLICCAAGIFWAWRGRGK